MKLKFFRSKSLSLVAGVFLIAVLGVVLFVAASNSLAVVTDSPYGFTFYVGPDPLVVSSSGVGSLDLFVWASAPYPDVYFMVYVDGVLLGEGYGQGRNNIVAFSLPVQGGSFSVGEHRVSASAVVSTVVDGVEYKNPAILNGADLLIVDGSVSVPEPTSYVAPVVTPVPLGLLTVNVFNAPAEGSFNLVSVFDENNVKMALSQTTWSSSGGFSYARVSLGVGVTYKVQVECAGYVTQVQSVRLMGDSVVDFYLDELSLSADPGVGVPVGGVPSGELNEGVVVSVRPWWQWIIDFLSFRWLLKVVILC